MTGDLKRWREECTSPRDDAPTKRIRYLSDDDMESMDWEVAQLEGDTIAEIKIQHAPTPSICYGSLADVKAEVTHIGALDTPIQPWTSFHVFEIRWSDNSYRLVEPRGSNFGLVDFPTSLHLRSIKGLEGISFRAVVSSLNFNKIPRKPTNKKTRINITINIFGPEDTGNDVGEALDKTRGYLQHPVFLEAGIKYANPHYFYLEDNMADLRHLIGPLPVNEKSQRISRAVENILDSLENTPISAPLNYDVEAMEQRFLRDTKLKSHQIKGIRFIISREDSDISERADREFLRLVDPSLISKHLASCRGGILADAMGLGKTLTMLSAIACARDTVERTVGPTLVVLPSRQVLDVWDLEIRRRFHPNIMKTQNFHGECRSKEAGVLSSYDIVLTTYHTLAADWKASRVLQNVNWLRVVLDEAHWIRNQSTQLFKAAESLKAEIRWCLTGTPIQNSLHDLRSLLKFLRFIPLCSSKLFDKHIINPLRSESDNSIVNLQFLLRVICLRRNSSLLELPPLETETVSVALSAEEKANYQEILADCQAEFDRQVCMNQKSKSYGILFATMVKLRRLCSRGIVISVTNGSRSPAASPGRSTYGDELCLVCSLNEADSSAILGGLEQCPGCGRLLDVDELTTQEVMAVSKFSKVASLRSPGDFSGMLSPSPSVGPEYSIEQGCSSKLNAVVSNIKKSSRSGSKSIAFTSWRSTLDTLCSMLSKVGIKFLRIDGRINSVLRSSVVKQFHDDTSISVLVMTIDSCAVGLTLTNADQVHIIEPQWNPAIEAQAIGRAYRMGQTRKVTVIRYITERSVEQNIVALQARKTRLANFSLDDSADGNLSGALEDMKFVLNPDS